MLRGARLQLKAKGSDGQSPLSAVEIGSLGDVARSEMLCRNDAYIGFLHCRLSPLGVLSFDSALSAASA